MNTTRAACCAALATTAVWTLKAVAIGVAGGLGRSPFESPLFLAGLGFAVITAVLIGVALAGRRGVGAKVLGGLLSLLAVALFGAAEDAVIAALTPARAGWVWGEINLWVLMITLLTITLVMVGRRSRTGTRLAAVAS